MSASVPVDVGTRGAIGSLLKEIEYRRLELDCGKGISNKSLKSTVETDSGGGGGHSWPSFGFLKMKWKKKKRRGTGGGLPAMCFVVKVSESCRLSEIPGFSYRNLKVDLRDLRKK